MAFRPNLFRNDPFGLCQTESFVNSSPPALFISPSANKRPLMSTSNSFGWLSMPLLMFAEGCRASLTGEIPGLGLFPCFRWPASSGPAEVSSVF
jgi:hypothetical protein